MGVGKNEFKSKSVEYSTPLEIFNPLKEEFMIALDVCASKENNKCPTYFTKEEDCLIQDWSKYYGNAWMNPPWGRGMQKFVRKAREESFKGKTIVCLLPVRSNTKWWHECIIDTKTEVRFLKGEIKFNGLPRGLWLPCAIVIFRPTDVKKGKLIFKEGEEVMLDTLMRNCGFGEKFDCMCNNGYTCHHKDNAGEYENCENKCRGCFAFQCPLAYQKDPEGDDKNARWGDETVMVLNEDLFALE